MGWLAMRVKSGRDTVLYRSITISFKGEHNRGRGLGLGDLWAEPYLTYSKSPCPNPLPLEHTLLSGASGNSSGP